MTECRLVAWTNAKAIRWVKEILPGLPAAWSPRLSPRRFSSSTPTGTTRKVVAVGTARLSFMLATSLAAGPLIADAPGGTVDPAAGCATGGMAAATAGRGSAAGREAG